MVPAQHATLCDRCSCTYVACQLIHAFMQFRKPLDTISSSSLTKQIASAGLVENNPSRYPHSSCPCADRATALSFVSSFVEIDYFCESGNPNSAHYNVNDSAALQIHWGRCHNLPKICQLLKTRPPPFFVKELENAHVQAPIYAVIHVVICIEEELM